PSLSAQHYITYEKRKLKMKINKFVLYIVFLLLLSGCSSNSYYSTLEKAVSKSIPYKVSNILHIEEVPEGAIVFYISPKEDHHVIGVTAFKKEDGKKGWKSVGPLDLTDYKTELISFNVAMINFYPQEPFNKKIPVIFG